ncbi:MAG TPA: hydroxyisourate hydrolase [Gemmatimonadales bacterium]|nr:hydroxyisourate hydrolase [Gemmatimonadales bacterium]
MSRISTHVLDTVRGRPAAGVAVSLALKTDEGWTEIGAAPTDEDGRVGNLLPDNVTHFTGTYRLRFDVGEYFAAQGVGTFYPYVEVVFTVTEDRPLHVPLLVSPFGYSTYRGS